jgi:CRP/FNR family transcriptional regulator, cyclic AMP receptor protein
METLERLLREHPFLSTMEERHLAFMTGCAANVRFAAGRFLFKEGDPANAAYLLREGRVALEVHAPERGSTLIATIEAGRVFGWSWLFAPYRWNFDARAVEPVRAITFDGNCLRSKCEADHDLGYELLKRFLQEIDRNLARVQLQLLDVYRANP